VPRILSKLTFDPCGQIKVMRTILNIKHKILI
jgi:hypothetical protein